MKPKYDPEFDFRLNELGQIDLNYYRDKALDMRARELGRQRAELKSWVISKLHSFYERYLCLNCHATR